MYYYKLYTEPQQNKKTQVQNNKNVKNHYLNQTEEVQLSFNIQQILHI